LDEDADDDVLLLLNANAGSVAYPLPAGEWQLLVDTSLQEFAGGQTYPLQGRSLALLRKDARPL
jgi:hypothetical protein